jgi:hypothetical protein
MTAVKLLLTAVVILAALDLPALAIARIRHHSLPEVRAARRNVTRRSLQPTEGIAAS